MSAVEIDAIGGGDFEAVIGLEVHAQLLTATKLFCRCSARDAPPNRNVCPVCLGLPGALPVLNREAVTMAARAGLALGCDVRERSVFARKSYFYPDLPKGYQLTQFELPLCEGGALEVPLDDGSVGSVRLQRIHMEEDAGKNLHGTLRSDASLVDLNRAGLPLIEIVSTPELRSGAEAAAYLRALRGVLMALGVNDGNLEEGSFRCDANVSVRRRGDAGLGTRCEIKNVNSFRFVQKAIEYEIGEQIATVRAGGAVRQCTKQWAESAARTVELRVKGNADDYRYFPEPDLPPLALTAAFLDALRATQPPLPAQLRPRYLTQLGLGADVTDVLLEHPALSAWFEAALSLYTGDARRLGNFVVNELKRDVRYRGLEASFPLGPAALVELLALVDAGALTGKLAKEVYVKMLATGLGAAAVVEREGLAVMGDATAIEQSCRRALEANPRQAQGYRAGKKSLLGFFVGAVMKDTGGRASPELVNATLERLLEQPS